jgi:hypothetical protein
VGKEKRKRVDGMRVGVGRLLFGIEGGRGGGRGLS